MTATHRALSRYQRTPTAPSQKDARTRLIREHANLLDICARAVSRKTGVDVEDLWSAGALGLLDAVERFDESRGARMTTWLSHRIRGAMLDEVRRLDRLPRRLRDSVSDVTRARDTLEHRLGRAPSNAEIAVQAELDEDAVAVALRAKSASDHPAADVDAVHVAADDEGSEALSMLNQDVAAVAAAVQKLPERAQLIISLRFVEDLTLKEIAHILELSEARVSQLLKSALQELQRMT
jgi:RNA polymerase sigma factor for flagellar operon FliA